MLDLLGPAAFWLAALFKARRLDDPGQRPVTLALTCLAVALTLNVDAVYLAVDRALGFPNVTNLLEHVFGLLGVFLLLTFLQQVSGRPTWTWTRTVAVVVVVTLSAGLFFAASPRPEATEFTQTFGHLALVKAYWVVTITYFGLCLVALLRLATGHSRRAQRREVRVGFAAVGAGVLVGVVYSGLKIMELLVSTDTTVLEYLDNVALGIGAALIGGGFLLPVIVRGWADGLRAVRTRRVLLRLRPAWERAITHRPGVVLGRAPRWIGDVAGKNASFRLYRRLIEIQDAALEAGLEVDPRTRTLLGQGASLSRPHVRGAERL